VGWPEVFGNNVMAGKLESGTGVTPVNHGRDGHATLKIRRGAYLPHWTMEGSIYAVTFRLADSMPQGVLESWLFEREDLLRSAEQMGRPLSTSEEEKLHELHSERVEECLDVGHGACWMKDDRIAKTVADALDHFDSERYQLLAWCLMPNHVRVVVKPQTGYTLKNILHSWKSFTAHAANRILGRNGQFWQEEYYDHLIRNEDDFYQAVAYVFGNPEIAGLQGWRWTGGTGVTPVNHGRDGHATAFSVITS